MLSAEALAVIGGTNCLGSLAAGWLGARYPKHILLGLLYILRAFVFTAYFILPPTPASTLLFAAAMGMLWLSVAPLVSGLVAEMFGTRYMATLLGIAFVMHQVGSSLGAFGGGLIFDLTGSYDWAWQFGVLMGFTAGVVQILAGGPTRGGGVLIGVVELVGAEVAVLGRRRLDQRAVFLPDPGEEGRRIDPPLEYLVVEVIDAGLDVRADCCLDPVGVGRLARFEQHEIGQRAIMEAAEIPAVAGRALPHMRQRLRDRDAARRDREHEPVTVFAGARHRA